MWLTYPDLGPSQREVRAGAQTGTKAETKKDYYLQAPSLAPPTTGSSSRPLAHEALWTRTQKVLQFSLSGAVFSLPRTQLLAMLPVFPSLLPSGDPLGIQNTPSLEEHYLLQIGAALHMVWKELITSPPPAWLAHAPLHGPSQQQISHWGNLCPPQRKKIQAIPHQQTIGFPVSEPDSV